ncbi:unnamed protein product [Fusarium equiseti]|uniref:Uncharacterized protein n=1 Tax=Fusarium equiseti TaxID=61235 RepID=A0A8J2IQW4_FUSEQ|nr:unnamed protein product [Fusarium equiseti]
MAANNNANSNVRITSLPPVSNRNIILFPVCTTDDQHLEAMGLAPPSYIPTAQPATVPSTLTTSAPQYILDRHPRLATDLAGWLDTNRVAMGQLALESLHGIAEELAYTCRREFELRNEFLERFPHAY